MFNIVNSLEIKNRFSGDFFRFDIKNKGNKSQNKQVGPLQTRSFCTTKEIINKMKKQFTEWKIFANDIYERELKSKIYNKSHKT